MIQLRSVGDVSLALAPVAALDGVHRAAFAELGDAERARLEGLGDARADELLLGRHLLRRLVRASRAGRPANDGDPAHIEIDARCEVCGGPHGRPVVVGHPVVASLAHAGGLAVAALAPTTAVRALGVDVEPLVAPDRDADATADPHARTRAWTRYEATLKADGRGIARNRGETDPAALAAAVAALPHRYEVTSLEVPGFAVAIAVGRRQAR
ncbi:hypothetical protein C8046_14015 [Serinibacter arcticus]|uniref:4'-phosphopantetheinyl transferase n=1 Tax=Serinibacter arcticus TaxID=1655435 RepID=A0A2U1ZXE3_9MICO|nr:hypothetical protein [Serinibacter arcticus]PWD51592.1 hypothetical protein C8046_14015 [Serinibacter arcticus]